MASHKVVLRNIDKIAIYSAVALRKNLTVPKNKKISPKTMFIEYVDVRYEHKAGFGYLLTFNHITPLQINC